MQSDAKTIPEADMPAPRLELRWVENNDREYPIACIYSLVLRLDKYDIRRTEHEFSDIPETLSVEVGKTLSTGTLARKYWPESDRVDTPFRDGAHARWDSEQLGNLPVYAVANGRAMLLEAEKRKAGSDGDWPGGEAMTQPIEKLFPQDITLTAISAEVVKARTKFPGNALLLAALTEEVGELAKALLQRKPRDVWEREAIQVAAVAVRIIEESDATFANVTDEQAKP